MGLTTYYSQGTCTVAADDTTVTGQGSSWLGKIRPGDLFGMHVGKLVRIASVDSATQLTLAHPWTGPTQTAAPYEIQQIQQSLDVAIATRELITRLDSGELFGRAAIDTLTVTGGTGDAIVVAPLAALAAGALFMLTANAANTGATTIQVPGIGTYPVEYADGTDLATGELHADNQTILYFDGDRFVVVISSVALSIPAQEQAVLAAASALAAADSVTAAAASAVDAAAQVALATDQVALASDFANAPEDVEVEPGLYSAKHWAAKAEEAGGGDVAGDIHGAVAKATPADADELGLVDSAAGWVLKKFTWANLKSAIASATMTLTNKTLNSPTITGLDASTSAKGIVELATAAEVSAGADTARVPSVSTIGNHLGVAKAWVNFDGTGTVSIKGSHNVSSVTDNGTGVYAVNLVSAMSDTNYATSASCNSTNSTSIILTAPSSTSSVTVVTRTLAGVSSDPSFVSLIVFGD